MRLLFCGDVVGRSGRAAISEHIPHLRKQLALDFVLINGENSASGFGITQKICQQFIQHGGDAITGGDHIWDQKEVPGFINNFHQLLRPANFPARTPGIGHRVFETVDGKKVLVIHLLCQLFMKYQVDCPFACVDSILESYRLGGNVDAIMVDIHGEATSEKMGMGHHLDGRVSMVAGTHTHVPTSDTQILPGGTAFQCDAGMCGDYNSVIGFKKDTPLEGFTKKFRTGKMEVANDTPTLSGVFVETNDSTGLAKRVEPVRVGGRLMEHVPEV